MTGILILYIVSMALMLSEMFVPGFIVGLLGITGLIASVIMAWQQQGPFTAMAMLAVAVIVVPVCLVRGMRRLSLQARVDGAAGSPGWQDFAGAEGPALCPLRPTGTALLKGRRADVVTRGEPVEKGAAVRVIAVEGNRLVVAAVK